MTALSMEHVNMIKFGTIVVMLMNSDCANFYLRTNSIAPSPVQKLFFLKVITLEPFDQEK